MRRRASLLTAFGLAALACSAHLSQVLYEVRSPYQTVVVSQEGPDTRSLRFDRGGATQSLVRLGHPLDLQLAYTRAAMVALAAAGERPSRVLVIGLGGGSMPMFLRAVLPQAVIDVVELDPEVARVARRWFGFHEDARLKVHVEDGRRFVERSAARWDLVLLDAYGRDNIPRALATEEFLAAVRDHLTPGGLVAGNVWSGESNALYASMRHTYESAFSQLCEIEVPDSGNRIFLARSPPARVTPEDFEVRAARLTREHGLPFDLAQFARAGCLRRAAPLAAASVLHDDDPEAAAKAAASGAR